MSLVRKKTDTNMTSVFFILRILIRSRFQPIHHRKYDYPIYALIPLFTIHEMIEKDGLNRKRTAEIYSSYYEFNIQQPSTLYPTICFLLLL